MLSHVWPGAALPSPATPFVGRADELAALSQLVVACDVRVVTLIGPAGVGKTRFAIEVAHRVAAGFAGGVVFVPLADLRDSAALSTVLLRALGVADLTGRATPDLVAEFIGERRLLLVLDNFEQIVDAAGYVADLVAACPSLTVLVTSRRALMIRAERCYHVAPLSLPGSLDESADAALRCDAVAFLVARLQARDTRFELSDAAAPVVAAICTRLEGLPLALELVATRARTMSLQAVLEALGLRLPMLTMGERDLPIRQRTMSEALAWSHDLLSSTAQILFQRLGACVGGVRMDTMRALLADLELAESALTEAVDELVAHSLLGCEAGGAEARFRMLEVVREFAAAQLMGSGELDAVLVSHAEHFLGFAEQTATELSGSEQASALDRLEQEAPNLTAAIRWTIEHEQPEWALRLCMAMRYLWYVRGPIAEGSALFDQALAMPTAPAILRAGALLEASALARHQGELARAAELSSEALAIARDSGDRALLATALLQRGFALHLAGQYTAARTALDESLALAHELDDPLAMARASHHLGLVAYYGEKDAALAWEMQCRCLAAFRAVANRRHVAATLIAMVELARARREHTLAHELLAEASTHLARLADVPLLLYALHHAAALAADEQQFNRAVRLHAAAEGLQRHSRAAPWPAVQAESAGWLRPAEHRLGTRRVDSLREDGRHLGFAGALERLTETADEPEQRLTHRERQIAELIADGLTNRAIAESLVISIRTVDGHVARSLTKLGFSSRAQLAAWVARGESQVPASR